MRQGKISALIHNSATHPNLDSCGVEVHFEEITDLVIHSVETTHRSPAVALSMFLTRKSWLQGKPTRTMPASIPSTEGTVITLKSLPCYATKALTWTINDS